MGASKIGDIKELEDPILENRSLTTRKLEVISNTLAKPTTYFEKVFKLNDL